MSESLSPATALRRAAKSLRAESRRYLPGGRDEAFLIAVCGLLDSEAESFGAGWSQSGEPSTDHALAVARAWLGEAS